MRRSHLTSLLIAASLLTLPVHARQADAIKRTPLQKVEYPGDKVSALTLIEVLPNGVVARHSHPGVELFYVLEGTAELIVDGQPPRILKAGDSGVNPVGTPHSAKAGPGGLKLIATFIVDKDKPLASPAP